MAWKLLSADELLLPTEELLIGWQEPARGCRYTAGETGLGHSVAQSGAESEATVEKGGRLAFGWD